MGASTLSVDCSFRATSTSDYVCLQKWGQVSSRSYLLDCRTERLGFAATKAAIKVMQREGRPASAVLIEARANGDAIIEELKADPDFGAALVAVEPEGGKERARMRLRSIAKQGTCIFPRTNRGLARSCVRRRCFRPGGTTMMWTRCRSSWAGGERGT